MPPLHQGDFLTPGYIHLELAPGGKLASNGDAGECVDGLCEVCELGSNRGCGGDAPICVAGADGNTCVGDNRVDRTRVSQSKSLDTLSRLSDDSDDTQRYLARLHLDSHCHGYGCTIRFVQSCPLSRCQVLTFFGHIPPPLAHPVV